MLIIIGHRGAAAYAPENTIASFKKANELGCKFVEFDVMLSADKVVHLFHDEKLKRITQTNGFFFEKDSRFLSTLDAGKWFDKKIRLLNCKRLFLCKKLFNSFENEKIPTLKTALEWLIKNNVHANIEIKPTNGNSHELTHAVIAEINRSWPRTTPPPLISSFDHEVLGICKSLAPEIPTGLLLKKWQDNWMDLAKAYDCASIHLNRAEATLEHVKQIKDQGYKVYLYTVNSKRLANKYSKWGVDGIFSDYPDLLSEQKGLTP